MYPRAHIGDLFQCARRRERPLRRVRPAHLVRCALVCGFSDLLLTEFPVPRLKVRSQRAEQEPVGRDRGPRHAAKSMRNRVTVSSHTARRHGGVTRRTRTHMIRGLQRIWFLVGQESG